MQHVAWDDLRLLLAVAHGRSYARAARHLGLDDTTVSRRLRGLERSIGHPLVGRRPDGSAALTPLGAEIARRAERMEAAVREIEEAVGRDRSSPAGTVRLTAVPMIVNRLLVPKLARLTETAPMVTVEFVPEARDLSLTRREADLALRLARPAAGGTRVLARRIGSLAYDGYVAAATDRDEEGALGWITYDDAFAHLPPARWLARAAREGRAARIVVRDAETMIEAAAHGHGRALLPRAIGEGDGRLRPVTALPHPAPDREVWLLSHREQRHLASMRAVTAWLNDFAW